METIGRIAAVIVGLSSGAVAAGAVFAFIAAIGIVPRLAQKVKMPHKIKLFEAVLMLGGIFAICSVIIDFQLGLGRIAAAATGVFIGIFIGMLAMSLVEVLDVLPIMTRRLRIQKGMMFFVFAIALGKMGGALMHAIIPGFYSG